MNITAIHQALEAHPALDNVARDEETLVFRARATLPVGAEGAAAHCGIVIQLDPETDEIALISHGLGTLGPAAAPLSPLLNITSLQVCQFGRLAIDPADDEICYRAHVFFDAERDDAPRLLHAIVDEAVGVTAVGAGVLAKAKGRA